MASNFKSSPALNENSVHEQWKKEIALWQAFTDLSAEKQGPAIFLTLSGKAREAVLEFNRCVKIDRQRWSQKCYIKVGYSLLGGYKSISISCL